MFPHLLEARMVRQPVISLFSGVGAFDLGLSELTRTIVYVEKDDYCQQVLQARTHDGLLDAAAIASDVPSSKIASLADGLTAGFPCQGVSKAGHQLGLHDPRTSLIKHVFRIMDLLIRLRFVLLENVNALLSGKRAMHAMWLYILKEFCRRGFVVRWCVISGKNAGLHVNRKRIFLYAARPPISFGRGIHNPS